MSADPTEEIRRGLIAQGVPHDDLEAVLATGGQVWTTEQMREEFEAIGFMAPYVVVRRKADGLKGSLEFTHSPRFYFGWRADS